ncbi:MAG TPA: hypothetical protein VLC46_26935 [Thermoanaerobaculia bacterium]|jgi:hypothetical protein|nr:hypothetical protein [Thermoanaerobaculia bacterium]
MHPCIKILFVSALVIASLGMNATTAKTSNESTLTVTQPDALDLYIEQLRFAESSGHDDIVIIDTNGKKSYGCLQFQEATFRRSAAKYHVEGDILDCATQRHLARAILANEREGWRNWFTSVITKGLGLPPHELTS